MKRLRHRREAFTLIELVMTIVVAAIIAVPLSLLLSQHIRSVFQSEEKTLARQLARFEMEKVNNMGYENINPGVFTYEGYDDYDITRTVTELGSANAEALKEITVEVTKSGDAPALISLVTYIAKNVGYGL